MTFAKKERKKAFSFKRLLISQTIQERDSGFGRFLKESLKRLKLLLHARQLKLKEMSPPIVQYNNSIGELNTC